MAGETDEPPEGWAADDLGGADGGLIDPRLMDLPAVGGRVQLELNAALTVSGVVRVRWGALHFRPNMDARLVGRTAFSLPFTELVGLDRKDGGRRVCVRSVAGEYVLRGEGAQRAWVALQVLCESADAPAECEPALIEQDPRAPRETGGLFGVSARGFGFAGVASAIGTVRSFWFPFASLRAVRGSTAGAMLVVHGDTLPLSGGGAGEFVSRLPRAWLAVMPPIEDMDGPWAARAVLPHEDGFDVGTLMIGWEGIVFEAIDGSRSIVAPRGALVRPQVDSRDPAYLSLEVGLEVHLFLVSRPAACVDVLDALCLAPDWGAPDDETDERALSANSRSAIAGPARAVRLIAQGAVVAEAVGLVLTPGASQVRYATAFHQEPLPVPFGATLEIDNKRGRFMVPGAVISLRKVDKAAGAAPGAPCFQATFRFTGEVANRNRREFYRLDVKESGASLFRMQDGGGELLDANTRLVNISRRGCHARVLNAPRPGDEILVTSVIGEEEVSLFGSVAHVKADGPDWLVGISYAEGSLKDGARLYNDRELEFLRRRSESE